MTPSILEKKNLDKSLAYIHPEAKIAKNVVVEPFSSIGKDVEIGEGTWIGPNVTIMEGARIGRNCKIYPGAVIAGDPQDLKYDGENTLAVIGNNVTIRECVTINKGTTDRFKTVVGDNCLLMAYVHVAHDCNIGKNVIMSNAVNLAGHVDVGDYCIMGGMSAVHQFVNIGKHAFVSGGSLVRKDVPPYVKAAREPISYVGVNSVGLRRRGFDNKTINIIQDLYRILYVKGHNITNAINIIEADFLATEERDEILSFIRESKRGIMKGFVNKNDN